MGIEPTALAWEARVLPLYDARASAILVAPNCPAQFGVPAGDAGVAAAAAMRPQTPCVPPRRSRTMSCNRDNFDRSGTFYCGPASNGAFPDCMHDAAPQ